MATPSIPIVPPILVGRTQELQVLDQALQAARRGSGSCILVAGEAGVGKTRLLLELRTRAAAEPFLVVQGNCFEPDVSFPYAPWTDALRLQFAHYSAQEIHQLLGPLAGDFC